MKQLLSDFLNLCFPQKEGYKWTWKEMIFGFIIIIAFVVIASFIK